MVSTHAEQQIEKQSDKIMAKSIQLFRILLWMGGVNGMIHYIGGAARCGKGILVRRLLTDLHLPYLSLDVLKMGLTRGLPELAFDPDAGGCGWQNGCGPWCAK